MASDACCAAGQPFELKYEPKGEFVQIATLKTYIVGKGNKRAIVVNYDIFGFGDGLEYKQVLQMADRLADAGFAVAVPDVLEGDYWPMIDFPPSDGNKFMEWVGTAGDHKSCAAKLKAALDHLKSEHGVTAAGVAGQCWGAGVAMYLASDDNFSACAMMHPALFGKDEEYAQASKMPICMLPTKDDPLDSVKNVMDKTDFKDKCYYERFDDQVHGFMGARGDYSKEHVANAAGKVIGILTDFFGKNIPNA